ncbi:MAG TPA: nuclear transport factor 2 family protein [Solirubrobacterales bacterium]|jgi:ketosteroid isomerase-like protein
MSKENVQALQRITAHFNENGEWGPVELYDPEVTFTTRGDIGGSQTYAGHKGLVDAMASFREAWAHITPQILDLIEGEDVVIAVIRFELCSQTGVKLKVEEAWVYWFREGRVKRVEQHATVPGALEAAGLSG